MPPLIDRLKNEKDRGTSPGQHRQRRLLRQGLGRSALPLLKEINEKYREEQQMFNAEAKKFQDDGDKEKAQQSRQKAQAAGQMTQACNQAMQSIAKSK